jgi:hypothetical protein
MPPKGSAPKCTRIRITNLSNQVENTQGEQVNNLCTGGRSLESGKKALGRQEKGPHGKKARYGVGGGK